MSFAEKLKARSTIKSTEMLKDSLLFEDRGVVPLEIPALNIAFSGKLDGGMKMGVTTFAGPSKHFKTLFALLCAKSYMNEYPDAALLFYDNEFGTPSDYFKSVGIDMNRTVHTPITDIEQLKHDMLNQLRACTRGDRLVIIVDSIGNIASKKELDDADEGKTVQDMTRAKQIKSLMRMVSPLISILDISLIMVNHVYQTQEMYSKTVMTGGTGVVYNSNNIFYITRAQDKDGDDLAGYKFTITVEKSRFCREGSKIGIVVGFDSGINKWSGLFDMALESGHIVPVTKQTYAVAKFPEKTFKRKATDTKEFWTPILTDPRFLSWIENRYIISNGSLMANMDTISTENNNV